MDPFKNLVRKFFFHFHEFDIFTKFQNDKNYPGHDEPLKIKKKIFQ